MPRCDLDFTVPSTTPRCSAISGWVRPSRCWSRTTVASSGGSSSNRRVGRAIPRRVHRGPEATSRAPGRRRGRPPAPASAGEPPVGRGRSQPASRSSRAARAGSRSTSIRSAACHAPYEGLLRRFLGEVVGSKDTICDCVHESSVRAVERAHARGIAALERLQLGACDAGRRCAGPARRRTGVFARGRLIASSRADRLTRCITLRYVDPSETVLANRSPGSRRIDEDNPNELLTSKEPPDASPCRDPRPVPPEPVLRPSHARKRSRRPRILILTTVALSGHAHGSRREPPSRPPTGRSPSRNPSSSVCSRRGAATSPGRTAAGS